MTRTRNWSFPVIEAGPQPWLILWRQPLNVHRRRYRRRSVGDNIQRLVSMQFVDFWGDFLLKTEVTLNFLSPFSWLLYVSDKLQIPMKWCCEKACLLWNLCAVCDSRHVRCDGFCLPCGCGAQLSRHTSAPGAFISSSAEMDKSAISFTFRAKSFFINTFLGSQQVIKF